MKRTPSITALIVFCLLSSSSGLLHAGPNEQEVIVCNGTEYKGACVYEFLITHALNHYPGSQTASRVEHFKKLGQSLYEAGDIETAKLVAFRALAEEREIFGLQRAASGDLLALLDKLHKTAGQPVEAASIRAGLPPMEKIERNKYPGLLLQQIDITGIEDVEPLALAYASSIPKEYTSRADAAYPLATLFSGMAVAYAKTGNYEKAVEYANKIGDTAFNESYLSWPHEGQTNDSFKASVEYARSLGASTYRQSGTRQMMGLLTGVNDVAIARYKKEGAESAKGYFELTENIFSDGKNVFPPLKHTRDTGVGILANHASAHSFMAGKQLHLLPDFYARASAATGDFDSAWKAYEHYSEGKGPPISAYYSRLEALRAIAEHPSGKQETEKILEALTTLNVEEIPFATQFGITTDPKKEIETNIHREIFRVLAALGSKAGIEKTLKNAHSFKGKPTSEKIGRYSELYAATSLAAMDDAEAALKHLEDFRSLETRSTVERSKRSEDIADAALAFAKSGMPQDKKKLALRSADEIIALHPPVTMSLVKMAIARKLVDSHATFEDELNAILLPFRLQNEIPFAIISCLNRAGLKEYSKPLISNAIFQAQRPTRPHGGVPTYYTTYLENHNSGTLASVATLLAETGDFAGADDVLRSIPDFTHRQKIGGTDLEMFSLRERTMRDVASAAAERGGKKEALKILKTIQHKPYIAVIYFNLAEASLKKGDIATAKDYYRSGINIAPDLISLVSSPIAGDVMADMDILVTRAAVEKKLKLTEALDKTKKMADSILETEFRNAKDKARARMIRDKVNVQANGEPSGAEDLDSFIASLNISPDFGTLEALRTMALEQLKAGNNQKARAIALYSVSDLDKYPQAKTKAQFFGYFADIIFRTDETHESGAFKRLIPLIKTGAVISYANRNQPLQQGATDYVDWGEQIYKEYQLQSKVSE